MHPVRVLNKTAGKALANDKFIVYVKVLVSVLPGPV